MAQKKNAPAIQKNNQSAQSNKCIVARDKQPANSGAMPVRRIIRRVATAIAPANAWRLLRQAPGPRQKLFGPDYYRAIERITSTYYKGHASGTPLLYAAFTAKWVYGCILPTGMYSALKTRGGWYKVYQWLDDAGLELLRKQIKLVLDTANLSADMDDFKARMMQLTNTRGQLGFVFALAQ